MKNMKKLMISFIVCMLYWIWLFTYANNKIPEECDFGDLLDWVTYIWKENDQCLFEWKSNWEWEIDLPEWSKVIYTSNLWNITVLDESWIEKEWWKDDVPVILRKTITLVDNLNQEKKSDVVILGSNYTLPTKTKEGYTFKWRNSLSNWKWIQYTNSIKVDNDIVLYVIWEENQKPTQTQTQTVKKYTITLIDDEIEKKEVEEWSGFVLETPYSKVWYVFKWWYTKSDWKWTKYEKISAVYNDMTLYSFREKNKIDITFKAIWGSGDIVKVYFQLDSFDNNWWKYDPIEYQYSNWVTKDTNDWKLVKIDWKSYIEYEISSIEWKENTISIKNVEAIWVALDDNVIEILNVSWTDNVDFVNNTSSNWNYKSQWSVQAWQNSDLPTSTSKSRWSNNWSSWSHWSSWWNWSSWSSWSSWWDWNNRWNWWWDWSSGWNWWWWNENHYTKALDITRIQNSQWTDSWWTDPVISMISTLVDIFINLLIFVWIAVAMFWAYKIMSSNDEKAVKEWIMMVACGIIWIIVMVSAKFMSKTIIDILTNDVEKWIKWVSFAKNLYDQLAYPFIKLCLYFVVWVLFFIMAAKIIWFITSTDDVAKKKAAWIIIRTAVWILVMLWSKQMVETVMWKEQQVIVEAAKETSQIWIWILEIEYDNIPIIYNIMNWIMWLSTFIVLVLILVQSYRMIAKPDDPKNRETLKKTILYVVIWVLVIWATYVISNVLVVTW